MKDSIIVRLEPEERAAMRAYALKMGKKWGVKLSESATIRMLVLAGLAAKR